MIRSFYSISRLARLSLVLFSLLIPALHQAQTISKPVICGNEIFHDILEKHHPALLENFNSTFDAALQSSRDHRSDPMEVNVVVHIIWRADDENLHDSIIQNQIEILNNDFNKLNADTSNLRLLFQPVAGNANIHFNLASVIRVQTDQLFSVDILGENLLSEVKHDADGGSDAVDPEHYINIWVCKIQPIIIFGLEVGQVFGFSFPPNNLPNWPAGNGAPSPDEDGLVIDYRVFGGNNPSTIVIPGTSDLLTVKGRTPVHEMGHYLGLRHIWGDGGLLGPNDCAQSDGIDDTPYADAQSNFDCDKTKNSCLQLEDYYAADVPDLVENFMDYAAEDCMNMFTVGQADLMRNVLLESRNGLLALVGGTHSVANQSTLSVNPNPAHDMLNVQLMDKDDEIRQIRLIDFNGKIMDVVTASNNNIPVSHLPAGMYVVDVISGKERFIGKLVIQH
ncbi:MAG TPA: zinc-dependent metalloprotease [Saprospiraceae bacterium]|nr:zinc-dependent metalloprotease [Saprospiraceae bacterium]